MKGKKGSESPKSGVAFANAAVPCTSKGNVMASAKRRKRGGAVAPMKVHGEKPKERLDKPKRAKGGLVADAMKAADSTMRKSDSDAKPMDKKPERKKGGRVGADTAPMTHAAREIPTRGHATGGNI